jgi:hypothetical protein
MLGGRREFAGKLLAAVAVTRERHLFRYFKNR